MLLIRTKTSIPQFTLKFLFACALASIIPQVQSMLKSGIKSTRRASLLDEPKGYNSQDQDQSQSSIQMWLARQGKYLKARPEIVMNYKNLLNWCPDKRKWSSKKPEFSNSQNDATAYKVDIAVVNAEIERKIGRLQKHRSTLIAAIAQLENQPAEGCKTGGILKSFLALPDWSFPTVEENLKANKLIAKVEDPLVLMDIAKALLIDLNNFVPTESELSVYQQMLFAKAEFIQGCMNLIADFPERYGRTRQFTLQQIMDIQENSIDERESINGMLKTYWESIKHEHRMELKDVKAKLSKKVTSVDELIEKIESSSKISNEDASVSAVLQESKEFLNSVRTAFCAQKLVYCDEQLRKIEEFENSKLPLLQEYAKTAMSSAATSSAKEQEIEDKRIAQKANSIVFQSQMQPTEIVQFLREAAIQRSTLFAEGAAGLKREESTNRSLSAREPIQHQSSEEQEQQTDERESLHKLISMSLIRKTSSKDFGEKRKETPLMKMKTVDSFDSRNAAVADSEQE